MRNLVNLPADEVKKRLSEYRALCREIKDDRALLARMRAGYMPADIPMADAPRVLARYRASVQRKLKRAACTLVKIEQYIESIPDCLVRHIFTLRYIEGCTWRGIAFRLHAYDESVPRKIHNRYLARLQEKKS